MISREQEGKTNGKWKNVMKIEASKKGSEKCDENWGIKKRKCKKVMIIETSKKGSVKKWW